MTDKNYSDKNFVDDLIKIIDKAVARGDTASVDHNRRLASRELKKSGKITDPEQRKRLEKKIRDTGAPFN